MKYHHFVNELNRQGSARDRIAIKCFSLNMRPSDRQQKSNYSISKVYECSAIYLCRVFTIYTATLKSEDNQ